MIKKKKFVFYLFVLNDPCKWTSSEYQLSVIHITGIFNTLSQQVSAICVAWFCFKAKTSHILEVLAQHSWNDRSGINKNWLRPPVRTNSIHKIWETSKTLFHYSVSSNLQSHNKHYVKKYCILLHNAYTRHHLVLLFTGQCLWAINSVTEEILINQSEDFSYFLISLQTLFSVPGLYSFHNVNVYIWIHVSWVNEQCSVTALVTLHWTIWETDCIGLTWKKWRENGHGIIPEFYRKSWGKLHWSYLAS